MMCNFKEYSINNKKTRNIIVTKIGEKFPEGTVIVGARYDSCFNPGADETKCRGREPITCISLTLDVLRYYVCNTFIANELWFKRATFSSLCLPFVSTGGFIQNFYRSS